MSSESQLNLFLCGDVMTGRGIDQILSHPGAPKLYESYVQDARGYVLLAEQRNGTIPLGVQGAYLWGDGLQELDLRQPDFRLINLETSLTSSNTPWLFKGINYRMNPDNIDAITAAHINVCALANNHVLDWGVAGFWETISTLDKAKIGHAGAGKNIQQAQEPAIYTVPGFSGRILVFSMGLRSSGILAEWKADSKRPGVWLLNDLGKNTIGQLKEVMSNFRKSGDLCIVSIHRGGNWGYDIPMQHQQFAHLLIDELGVQIVHGHSSHHPIAIERYQQRLILYGCGDLINDYEGITGWEHYRSNLALMYFPSFDTHLRLHQLELVPFLRKNFKLHYAPPQDCLWLAHNLKENSAMFATDFELDEHVIYCL